MKKTFLLSLCLSLLWMGLIFYLSSQPAEESTGTSLTLGKAVASLLVPGFGSWDEERQNAFAEKIDHPIRKTAHATEYAILSFLLGLDWLLLPYGIREKYKSLAKDGKEKAGVPEKQAPRNSIRGFFPTPFLSAVFYACTDELHQLFVPGRAGMLSDVLLDSAGAAAGLLFLYLLSRRIRADKKYHASRQG